MKHSVRWLKGLMCAGALLVVAANAFAAPINLTCTAAGASMDIRLTIDESASTAVFGDDPISHAVFTDSKVKWNFSFPAGPWQDQSVYELSRETGVLVMFGSSGGDRFEGDKPHHVGASYNCYVAQKKF
jgi:hypothetical protein